jgi:hypothetical protein
MISSAKPSNHKQTTNSPLERRIPFLAGILAATIMFLESGLLNSAAAENSFDEKGLCNTNEYYECVCGELETASNAPRCESFIGEEVGN